MKKIYITALLFTLVTYSCAEARFKVNGNGEQLNFDPDSIPLELKTSYDTMNKICTNCHSMKKIVISVQTGRGPDTKQPFDKQTARAYCIKMLRKKDTVLMTKNELKSVYQLLSYLLDNRQ
ncbi:MAG TPA: hypothetical protein VGJ93_09060 [Desulfuromonadaceae bacterium]|jgi:hypothetical protein